MRLRKASKGSQAAAENNQRCSPYRFGLKKSCREWGFRFSLFGAKTAQFLIQGKLSEDQSGFDLCQLRYESEIDCGSCGDRQDPAGGCGSSADSAIQIAQGRIGCELCCWTMISFSPRTSGGRTAPILEPREIHRPGANSGQRKTPRHQGSIAFFQNCWKRIVFVISTTVKSMFFFSPAARTMLRLFSRICQSSSSWS